MRRADLLRRVSRAARRAGVEVTLIHGHRHDRLEVGGVAVVIPRHAEINEYTARGILSRLESVLGEGWWR